LVFLNQSIISEAEVTILTNYDMIQYVELQNHPDKDQVSGQLFICLAGVGVTGGVIVNKNQACRAMAYSAFYNLAGTDTYTILCTFKEVNDINNLASVIQIKNLE